MAVDLIEKLLEKNPAKRLKISTALKHAWFKANFDLANRSAGEGHENKKNLIRGADMRLERRGSFSKKDPEKKKSRMW